MGRIEDRGLDAVFSQLFEEFFGEIEHGAGVVDEQADFDTLSCFFAEDRIETIPKLTLFQDEKGEKDATFGGFQLDQAIVKEGFTGGEIEDFGVREYREAHVFQIGACIANVGSGTVVGVGAGQIVKILGLRIGVQCAQGVCGGFFQELRKGFFDSRIAPDAIENESEGREEKDQEYPEQFCGGIVVMTVDIVRRKARQCVPNHRDPPRFTAEKYGDGADEQDLQDHDDSQDDDVDGGGKYTPFWLLSG